MATRPPVAVLLDVDGTLIDTTWIHTLAWTRALERLGESVPMHRIHPLVGLGSDRLVEEATGRQVEGASEAHQAEYLALADDVRLLPGARDLLRLLHEAGARPVLATSSPPELLAPARELLAAEEWLHDVTSAGDVEEAKPAPDIFSVALERAGADPDRAVAVGDARWDVEAARAAGVPVIGLLTGGWRGTELIGAGASEVYEDPAALAEDLGGSIIGRALAGGHASQAL